MSALMELLTVEEICKSWKLSTTTFWRWRKQYRDFPKPIRKRWRADELNHWLMNNTPF